MKHSLALCLLAVIGWSTFSSDALAQPPRRRMKTTEEVIQQGVDYLKSTRSDQGTWSADAHVGITPVVLTALLRTGRVSGNDPIAKPGLDSIVALAHPEAGHLANSDRVFHKNYVTSVGLLALIAANDPQYAPVISQAVDYLKTVQFDEGEKKTTADHEYGGFGYNGTTRADLSNTHFALDALTTAGVPSSDPVFQKGVIFVSRLQNLPSEWNQQPWATLIGDGSFIYVLATRPGAGEDSSAVTPRPGYGSMTYAGLKCLLHGGVPKSDLRFQKGFDWLTRNYSVDQHAGRAPGDGWNSYYYYLLTMAKSLHAQGIDEVIDAGGVAHDWRAEITRALSQRQQPNGSWVNLVGSHLESNSDLDTAYALMTLVYCNPELAQAKKTEN